MGSPPKNSSSNLGELKSNVAKWLKQKGYPLEMKVSSLLSDMGFGVSQAEFYVDPETSKSREIDVIGALTKFGSNGKWAASIQLAIECKYSMQKPWILFSSNRSKQQALRLPSQCTNEAASNLLTNITAPEYLPKQGFFRGPLHTAYSVSVALEKDDNQRDVAYNALLTVTNAAEQLQFPGGLLMFGFKDRIVTFKMPIIVIQGILLNAHLDSNNTIILEPVEHGRLYWKRWGEGGGTIDIVTLDYLPTYANSVNRELEIIQAACDENDELATQSHLAVTAILTRNRRKEIET